MVIWTKAPWLPAIDPGIPGLHRKKFSPIQGNGAILPDNAGNADASVFTNGIEVRQYVTQRKKFLQILQGMGKVEKLIFDTRIIQIRAAIYAIRAKHRAIDLQHIYLLQNGNIAGNITRQPLSSLDSQLDAIRSVGFSLEPGGS